jgi:hypothetical protein
MNIDLAQIPENNGSKVCGSWHYHIFIHADQSLSFPYAAAFGNVVQHRDGLKDGIAI